MDKNLSLSTTIKGNEQKKKICPVCGTNINTYCEDGDYFCRICNEWKANLFLCSERH
jgi:uncharacterized Zn finger protein (UPF0148 family)